MSINGNDVMSFFIKEIPLDNNIFWRKINKNTTWVLEKPHVVKQLRTMIIGQLIDGFAFNNDIAFTQKINTVKRLHLFPMICRVE